MLEAKDFRRYARESLKGRWLKAGGVGLLAGVLGASISTTVPSVSSSGGSDMSELISNNISGTAVFAPEIPAMTLAIILGVALVVLLWAVVVLVIGGATTLGYAKYNLNLVDDHDPKLRDLFSQYDRIGTGFGMQFFRGLFVALWSLLLVIPGIIARYSYYMTPFILCENPDMTAREAIRESKELMKGNRWRLFCLGLSFIGWDILAIAIMWVIAMLIMLPIIFESGFVPIVFILGVVLIVGWIAVCLTLSPYITASIAVFYREISEGRYSNPQADTEAGEFTYEGVSETEFKNVSEIVSEEVSEVVVEEASE